VDEPRGPADRVPHGHRATHDHLRRALGLGALVTVFAAAGAGAHGARDVLAQRVSASLTAATVILLLALVVTLIARPRKHAEAQDGRPHSSTDTTDPVPATREALLDHCAAA
jgi:hypothetical protein